MTWRRALQGLRYLAAGLLQSPLASLAIAWWRQFWARPLRTKLLVHPFEADGGTVLAIV